MSEDIHFECIDTLRPDTWRNQAGPDLSDFNRALEEHFGYNDYGQPQMRAVWGQQETRFWRGKVRLKYIDTRIPPLETFVHLLKRMVGVREERAVSRVFGSTEGALDVQTRMAPVWETQVLDAEPTIIPEGWLYEKRVRLEFIGEQLVVIEQFIPPHIVGRGDTPESWERQRWGDWDDPEEGLVRNCDLIGPFPAEGRYEAVTYIGEPYSYPYFVTDLEWSPIAEDFIEVKVQHEGRHLKFKMPDADTLEALVAQEQERELRPQKSLTQMAIERAGRLDSRSSSKQFRRRRDACDAMRDIIKTCRGPRGESVVRELLGPELAAQHNV
jgi:hypothetical protein